MGAAAAQAEPAGSGKSPARPWPDPGIAVSPLTRERCGATLADMSEQPQQPEQTEPAQQTEQIEQIEQIEQAQQAEQAEPGPAPYAEPPYAEPPYAQHPPRALPATADPLSPDQERTWAAMAHVLALPAMLVAMAFLAPLIVLLAYGNRSAWVRRHAVESLNFQITGLLLGAAAGLLTLLTLGVALIVVIPLGLVYGVFWLVVVLLATFAANRGEDYRYPLTLRLVK